jgi:hypothetical protein
MTHSKATTLSIMLALPILASGMTSLNAQNGGPGTAAGASTGGPGTAAGAATSRAQIGVKSPAGVVLPNATGTGLGATQPGYIQTFQAVNPNVQPGSFQVPRRGASALGAPPTLGTVRQTRCAGAASRTGTTTTSADRGTTAVTGVTTTSTGTTDPTGVTTTSATTTSTSGAAAQVLVASTGSRPAGLTPITGTGANCQP